MAEKKKASVRVEPPEQKAQVSEQTQNVAPESRYSLQARVDRLVDKPDGKLRAILSMNLPGGFAVHGIKIYENKTIEHLLLQLARQLSTSTGKKQYGYLKPDLKRLVDAIVTEFAKDPRIAELYDLWYDQKESGIRFYQDEMPERVSLGDNPEFRTVKNAVLQAAEGLTKPGTDTTEQAGGQAIHEMVVRLLASIAQTISEDPDRCPITKIDRKQRRQIDEKKLAQGMKLE